MRVLMNQAGAPGIAETIIYYELQQRCATIRFARVDTNRNRGGINFVAVAPADTRC